MNILHYLKLPLVFVEWYKQSLHQTNPLWQVLITGGLGLILGTIITIVCQLGNINLFVLNNNWPPFDQLGIYLASSLAAALLFLIRRWLKTQNNKTINQSVINTHYVFLVMGWFIGLYAIHLVVTGLTITFLIFPLFRGIMTINRLLKNNQRGKNEK